MAELIVELGDPLMRGLACAALSPGLRSVLIYDIPPDALRGAASVTALFLDALTGQLPRSVTLGVSETDDDLWGRFMPGKLAEGQPELVWHHGLVATGQDDASTRLVVIPNLTMISLAIARTGVALVGAEIAHLERHGRHDHWQPDLFWIAGCPGSQAAVGQVSPHLLDRFALRLSWERSVSAESRAVDTLRWANELPARQELALRLPERLRELLRAAAQHRPAVPQDMLSYLLSYFPHVARASTRRTVALMRLAIANAQLIGAESLTAAHIDAAAKIIGLTMPGRAAGPQASHAEFPPPPLRRPSGPVLLNGASSGGALDALPQLASPVAPRELTAFKPDMIDVMPSIAVEGDPYREDSAPVQREVASLQLPAYQGAVDMAGRGPVVGVQPAVNLHDLAIVSSLLEAAKFQAVRRQTRPELVERFRLLPTDLRSYRRAPVADRMLVLAIDHTCLRHWDYLALLEPYLQWAYIERASICIVQIGAAGDHSPLQAERVISRNLLDPRITAALTPQPGRATPLAHGLDLALNTLRHALQHGRSAVREAALLVISDGRGNVPISVSHGERPPGPVVREGIDDALRVARELRLLDRVRTLLISPRPRIYASLPVDLARTLGALIIQAPDPDDQPGTPTSSANL